MDYERIAMAVEQRKRALGLSNTALAQRAGVDRGLIAKVLSGKPWSMRTETLGRIERALGWPAGAIEDVGRGLDLDVATPSEDRDRTQRLDAIDGRLGRIEGLLEQLVDDSRAAR